MKSYLLLRDNQESGPYTLEEIRKKELQPFDLIWIEGESTSWCYPTEIKGLKTASGSKRKSQPSVAMLRNISFSKPVTTQSKDAQPQSVSDKTNHVIKSPRQSYFLYEDVAKELFTEVKPDYRPDRKTFTMNKNIMGLMLIIIGVVMGSFVVKNIVESFGTDGGQAEQAKVVQSMTYQSDNAGYAPQHAASRQNLINNISPLKTDTAKRIRTHALTAGTATKTSLITIAPIQDNSGNIVAPKVDVSTVATTEQPKADDISLAKNNTDNDKKDDKDVKKVKDIRAMVHLSSNNYKVGLLGGISDLELQVNNDSPNTVDKATVEVNYMKPNGSVIKTEIIEVNNIAPGKSKKVQVPSSNRGTKVQFRINSASSHEADAS